MASGGLIADLMVRVNAQVQGQRELQRLNAQLGQLGQGAQTSARHHMAHANAMSRSGTAAAGATRQLAGNAQVMSKGGTAASKYGTHLGALNRGFTGAGVGARTLASRLSPVVSMLAPASGQALSAGAAFGGGGAALGVAGGGAALAFGLFKAGQAAVQFESDFAGVKKTVEGTPGQLQGISDELRRMATEIPTTTTELTAIAGAAGSLGIKTDSVVGFTRTIADLNETTNLLGEEGASQMARLANITQMPQNEFDRLGSTAVHLGNKMASTEAEIVDFGLRVAGAGHQVGLTEAEILGVAAALSSVGIESEAGGSAVSRVMIELANAVDMGGAKLDQFAGVAGVSAATFSEQWATDPAMALVAFVEGLGRVEAQGGSTFQVLDQLGLSEIRVRDAMLRASGAGDILRQSIAHGNEAWEENTALTEEAGKRYDTTAAKIEVARNNIHDLSISLGETFLPAIGGAADGLSTFMRGLRGEELAPGANLFDRTVRNVSNELSSYLIPGLHVLRSETGKTSEYLIAQTERMDSKTRDAAGGADVFSAAQLHAMGRTRGTGDAAAGATPQLDAFGGELSDAATKALEFSAATQASLSGIQGFMSPMRAYTDLLGEHNQEIREQAERATESQNASIDKQIQAIRDRASARVEDYRAERSTLGESEDRQSLHFKKTTNETIRGMEKQSDARIEGLEGQKRSTDDFYKELESSFSIYMQALNRQLDDQRAWHKNLNTIREKADDEYADMLMQQGPEYAALHANIADQSAKEIRKARDKELQLRRAGAREQLKMLERTGALSIAELIRSGELQVDATGEVGGAIVDELAEKLGVSRSVVRDVMKDNKAILHAQLGAMKGVAKDGAGNVVDAMGNKLQGGSKRIAKIVADYSKAIAEGLNPVIAAAGGKQIAFRDIHAARFGAKYAVKRNEGGPIPGSGPDRDTVPAMLTPGEYVLRRKAVKRIGVDTLDRLNRGDAQALNIGGIVQAGRAIQRMGYLVGEHPAFGGVAPVHSANSYHYRGQALDINWPGGAEPSKLDSLKAWILSNVDRKLIRELIWRAPGHETHLHLAMGGGKGTFMPGGGAAMAAPDLPKVPSTPKGALGYAAGTAMDYARKAAQEYVEANSMAAGGQVGTDLASVSGSLKQMAMQLLAKRGWSAHWGAFNTLVGKESSWNPRAQNPTSTAYGLGQFLDSTWAGVGGRKTSDPKLQLEYMMRYISNRYGNPSKALAFHLRNNWYDRGGILQPGVTTAVNATGGPEVIAAKGMIAAEVAAALVEVVARTARETKLQKQLDKLTGKLADFEKSLTNREDKQERKSLTRELQQLRRETRSERARLEKQRKAADSPKERKQIRKEQRQLERSYRGERQDIQLQQRDAKEQKRVDTWQRQIEKLEEAIAAEQEYIEKLQEHVDTAKSAFDDEVSSLNGMLDAYDAARQAEADARKRYDEAAIEASKRLNEQRTQLEEQYQQQVKDLLEGRRDELRGWMAFDQMPDGSKIEDAAAAMADLVKQLTGAGMTESSVDLMARRGGVGGLVDNVSAQTAAMREWREGLAALRGRGVSEDVFAGLDLESSPEMLQQVKQLVAATDAELVALNEAVAARNAEIDVRVAEEQRLRLGKLGEQLIEAKAAYDEGISQAQAQFHADMQAANEQLQGDLQAAREQLAEIGADTGRDWATAIAEGVESQLPAILAQVAKVKSALAELQSAEKKLDKASGGSGKATTVAPRTQAHPVTSLPGYGNTVTVGGKKVQVGSAEWAKALGKSYDSGGILPPGVTLAVNRSGRDEHVMTAQQVAQVRGSGRTVNITINAPGANPNEIKRAVVEALDEADREAAREWQAAGLGV